MSNTVKSDITGIKLEELKDLNPLQAEEVSYNEMLDQISFQHRQENNYSGIDKTYKDLKTKSI